MPQGTCSIDGCESDAKSRGMCNRHYQQRYRGIDPNKPRIPKPRETCSVEACESADRIIGGKYCASHYAYWKRTGETPTHLIHPRQKLTCTREGCERSTKGGGLSLCPAHYQRYRLSGDAGAVEIADRIEQDPNCRICGEPSKALSLCNKHYRRQWRGKDPEVDYVRERKSIEDRFWPRVDKDGPVPPHRPELGRCWVWTGAAPGFGYGVMGVGGGYRRNSGTHRVSWEIHHGPIPDDLHVLHKCDNPPCVRPEHLFLGTQRDNAQDMSAKGRAGGSPKLTWDKVEKIRAELAAGVSRFVLAEQYGVTAANIWCIGAGRSWDPEKRRPKT